MTAVPGMARCVKSPVLLGMPSAGKIRYRQHRGDWMSDSFTVHLGLVHACRHCFPQCRSQGITNVRSVIQLTQFFNN